MVCALLFFNLNFGLITSRYVQTSPCCDVNFHSYFELNILEYSKIQPTYVNMSELATMAALKISNSINQHYQQQNQEPLTPVQPYTPNMSFSAQSPQSDSSSVTTTNNNFTTNTNTTNSMNTNPESPDASLTDEALSRQASTDAAPSTSNDYEDYAIRESTQTLSSSTSGITFVFFLVSLHFYIF